MRTIVTSHGYSGWAGGIDFLHHILTSLLSAGSDSGNSNILVLPTEDKGYSKDLFTDLSHHVELVFAGPDMRSQFKRAITAGADVVMPCFSPPDPDLDLPWVGYLYDFQHCCLPEFFTPRERAIRDVEFYQMLHRAGHIIVNSHAVADDARIFFGDFPAKIHVLPFSPCPQLAWLQSDLDIREKYGIDKPYFMVCNQFWRHKDHGAAFTGFTDFLRTGNDALLVCTGKTVDYRFPDHFLELQDLIKNRGMQDKIMILGHIPKSHQINLIKHAMAMVQPTLFEGGPGGGAAYDAISLGVPVICSDIPVNMEIDCGDVRYFEARNPAHLAQRMVERASEEIIPISNEHLWQQGVERKRRCGDLLINIAEQAIEESRKDTGLRARSVDGKQLEILPVLHRTSEDDRTVQFADMPREKRELGRILALVSELSQLKAQFQSLTAMLKESESDRAARLEQIHELTRLLKESESDRAARLEQIYELTRLLKESESDRAARGEQIQTLTAMLKDSVGR